MGRLKGDAMVSMPTLLMAITVFAILQIFLQINSANLRQIPNQCDCQCTKQLHINSETHSSEKIEDVKQRQEEPKEVIVKAPAAVPKKSVEERNRMQILEAEDKALDREIAANQTKRKQEIVEDPEEKSPYQPERLSGAVIRNETEKLVSSPLKENPLMNASSLHCSSNSTNLLLFYIYSAPGNFEARNRIRESYGSVKEVEGKLLRYIFFIGDLSIDNRQHYTKLLNESKVFGDLVQDTSYTDAYRNLTLKGISALRWVAKYCPVTYRVMKIDDDTMINPYTLIYFLHGQSDITMGELICKVTQGVGPIRNPKSKYYVSKEEYADDYYPPYCQGYGYIFPPYMIPKMVEAFDQNPLIAMEDVFFTGMTCQQIGFRLHPLTALYATTFNKFEIFLERITTRPELLMVGHVHEARYVEIFWQLAKQRENTRIRNLEKEQAKKKREEKNDKDDNDVDSEE
ncbi:beta-1,3-galactosyltransferase 4-like [Watersipora subatra]|uniref:beta-1,3-galactosyltransferase 4-like n=1 Tax=Watersipora subatra TaxID=2589382 RepID=UPI00355AF840